MARIFGLPTIQRREGANLCNLSSSWRGHWICDDVRVNTSIFIRCLRLAPCGSDLVDNDAVCLL